MEDVDLERRDRRHEGREREPGDEERRAEPVQQPGTPRSCGDGALPAAPDAGAAALPSSPRAVARQIMTRSCGQPVATARRSVVATAAPKPTITNNVATARPRRVPASQRLSTAATRPAATAVVSTFLL